MLDALAYLRGWLTLDAMRAIFSVSTNLEGISMGMILFLLR